MTFGAAPLPVWRTGCQVPREPFKEGQVRLFIVGCLLLLSSGAAAQSRWTLSAGPEWAPYYGANQFIGGRVRGEYDLLVPTKPLRLRLELGGYWEPSQTYSFNFIDGSGVSG